MKVVGTGGRLRENSSSLGALRRTLAASEDAGAELLIGADKRVGAVD